MLKHLKKEVEEKYFNAVETEKENYKSTNVVYIDLDGFSKDGKYILGVNVNYLDNFKLQKNIGTTTFEDIHKEGNEI